MAIRGVVRNCTNSRRLLSIVPRYLKGWHLPNCNQNFGGCFGVSVLRGRNTLKHVPCRTPVLLRMRMDPPCLAKIPWLTQRPTPVPFSPLVVKKGLNSLGRVSLVIPDPSSPTSTLIPG